MRCQECKYAVPVINAASRTSYVINHELDLRPAQKRSRSKSENVITSYLSTRSSSTAPQKDRPTSALSPTACQRSDQSLSSPMEEVVSRRERGDGAAGWRTEAELHQRASRLLFITNSIIDISSTRALTLNAAEPDVTAQTLYDPATQHLQLNPPRNIYLW